LYDLLAFPGDPAATPRAVAVGTSPAPSCGEKTLPWAHSYTSSVYWEADAAAVTGAQPSSSSSHKGFCRRVYYHIGKRKFPGRGEGDLVKARSVLSPET